MTPSYVLCHRVTFDETNLVGNVYFAHYLHWQGHCREHFLADHAPGVLDELRTGFVLATVSCSADFYTEAWAGDLVEVHLTLERITGNRIAMSFDYRRGGELLARGRQTVACLRRTEQGLQTAVVPAELRRALEPYAEVAR